jgi:predicted  nucleic acid-binding Zn-ribbon protein
MQSWQKLLRRGIPSEKSIEYQNLIEARLLAAYTRIRTSVRNGLAVVSIERGASAGSFFTIPPQTQVEIASRKNYYG